MRSGAISSFYAAAQDLASTASGGAKSIYLDKAKDALRDMSKWLQEKQMTAFEVTYQGKTKTLQEWTKGVSLRDKARLGPEERINFRDVVNVISGLALNNQFADVAPEYPTFSALVTESNRKQLSATRSARWQAEPAPRTRSPFSMRWRCSTATASTRPARATPRRCWPG